MCEALHIYAIDTAIVSETEQNQRYRTIIALVV